MDKLNKGLKETTQSIEKLGDNLDKVDVKVNTLSISAKDVAEMCKKGLDEIMEYTVLQTAKIGAIVTELNAIVGQAINKNIKAGEKLAQEMEKSGGDTISSLKLP